MTTSISHEESLVERTEILFPSSLLIDPEPMYSNFTAIQNALRHRAISQQSHSVDNQHTSAPNSIKISLSSKRNDFNQPSTTFRIPIESQSKSHDPHIFNLARIITDIGYDRKAPFVRTNIHGITKNGSTKNVSALLDIVLKMGGAEGPLVNVWRSRLITEHDFREWYLKRSDQRHASMIKKNPITHRSNETTQNTVDYRSHQMIDHSMSDRARIASISNEPFGNHDETPNSGTLYENMNFTRQTANDLVHSKSRQSILKSTNGNPMKQHRVTIVEDPSVAAKNSQVASDEHIYENGQNIITDYEQVLRDNPDVNQDLNPELITKPNPDTVTYQQNITVRYLAPPTPPPPGPLIIREIVPPRPPTPPPIIVTYQESNPPTPPPLILREAPPTPPPVQEPTIVTRILPADPQPPPRVIYERSAPLPVKPRPIIIERWLPYKQAPPREVIYETVNDATLITQQTHAESQRLRNRRHSAEYKTTTERVSIPVSIQRHDSVDNLNQAHLLQTHEPVFNQLSSETHQNIFDIQRRGREQVAAHQQWAANQWQQHALMMMQYGSQPFVPNVPLYFPTTMTNTAGSYVHHEVNEHRVQYHSSYLYPMY